MSYSSIAEEGTASRMQDAVIVEPRRRPKLVTSRARVRRQRHTQHWTLLRTLAVCGMGIAIAACAATPPRATDGTQPRIVDVRAGRFIGEAALVDALAGAQFVLLGERHDNPAHHAMRARWITAIAERGRRPAVVLEAFDLEHDAALRAGQRDATNAEQLADAGRLDRKAWRWPLHRPIVDAALSAGLPLRAGNVSSARLGELVQQAASDTNRFSNVPWSASQQATLTEEIVEGHCRKLPADAVPRLVLAQRLRDDAMAQALVDAATAHGAILVAGNGHVRKDLGVPPYFRARVSQASVVSVGLVEADPRSQAAAVEVAAKHAEFDYVVVTEAVARPDPCATIPATIGR
jgi:uncharacterized iron-regulated protein